jgi:anhydro-N-acetylmuramic acid kinase
LQIGDPNTIAELTGVTTVADFRRRDLAAGGEGAPLAPAFHAAMFSSDHCNRAIVNIGGLANLTLLPASGGGASGFDTGPGNTLLDQWVQKHTTAHYDADGEWAAEGRVHTELLAQLARHPFLRKQPPKSTGKETFNMDWLTGQLTGFATVTSRDVQATLAEFTAATIVDAIQSQPVAVSEVYICGGGAANQDLMRRLYQRLGNIKLGTTTELGCDPGWVEAAAFAWLAERTLNGESGSLPAVTGAAGGRILGGIYPAANPAAQK